MDVFVQLGVVGLSLYLAMGLLLGWRLVTYRPANNAERAGVAFLMGLFVIAIVHGLTESTVSEARIAGLAMGVAVLAMAKPVFATAGALRGAGGQSRARAFESPSTTPNPPYAY